MTMKRNDWFRNWEEEGMFISAAWTVTLALSDRDQGKTGLTREEISVDHFPSS